MTTQQMTSQVRAEVEHLKEAQNRFLETYRQLCVSHADPKWPKGDIEMVFHRVRSEIIPIMEEVGMDPNEVQALCSWAEKRVMQR
jgi:hypothetical protein